MSETTPARAPNRESAPRKVLVTGAAGSIGQNLCPLLAARGFQVRGFDRCSEMPVEDAVVGELSNLDALTDAAAGMDAMLHLAACSDDADFVTRLVPSNVVGMYHAFEAARRQGVQRIVVASSCQAADLARTQRRVSVEERHPADLYGLTKLWAEDLGRLVARGRGPRVFAARLGWVVRDAADLALIKALPGGVQLYLSARDAHEFLSRCLTAPLPRFAVAYAFSRQLEGEIFDMEPARRLLGFEPQDTFPEGLSFDRNP